MRGEAENYLGNGEEINGLLFFKSFLVLALTQLDDTAEETIIYP